MQITGAATTGAHRQLARKMRLGGGGKRGTLLVAHMHPLDFAALAQRIGKPIQ
jgi:hypothetical protein